MTDSLDRDPTRAESGTAAVMTADDRTRLILSGPIDLSMVGEFSEAVTECLQRALPLDVDLRHVTFMDSSGVATLARLLTKDSPAQPVRMIKPPDMVQFLLDVTGLSDKVEILTTDPGFPAAN